MSVLVTDRGFAPAPPREITALVDLDATTTAVDLVSSDDPEVLAPHLARLTLIRVAFPSFADGRGFTIGRRLRMLGYKGELLAHGHVISDQYPMARRVGFDGVEISDELAARQPEAQWTARSNSWGAYDYQSRLRA